MGAEGLAKQARNLMPENAKLLLRSLRAWGLSLNLSARGPFPQDQDEKRASASMSIVVAVHDSPEVTLRCLESLEVFGGDAEILVVDDGSKLELTRELLDKVCSRNGWRLIRHEKALGHSRASEAGVAVSTRPYICLLNSDTVVTQRSWLGILRAFDSAPNIAVVGPSTSHTAGPQVVERALHCCHYWSDEQIWGFAGRYVARHQDEPLVDLPDGVGGFAFFVRRSVWDQLGGFDKALADYGNESEFCRRVTKAGLRIAWTKASYIHHLGGATYGRTVGAAEIRKRCLEATAYIQKKFGH
jgi:GT2 family glycosyltransferase